MIFFNRKFIFSILFFASLLANAFLGAGLASYIQTAKQGNQRYAQNQKILAFTNQFIEKVLMASQEVDFDARLKLETMVRDIGDKEILDRWQRFTATSDSQGASYEAKELLNLLVKKSLY